MSGQVDLDALGGKEDTADDKPSSGTKRSAGKAAPPKNQRSEKELTDRIMGVFDRLTASMVARGDERLAQIIQDDAQVMAAFLVTFTRPFAAIRGILLGVVSLIEPALAFGRLFRELAGRWAQRRAERNTEDEQPRPPEYH